MTCIGYYRKRKYRQRGVCNTPQSVERSRLSRENEVFFAFAAPKFGGNKIITYFCSRFIMQNKKGGNYGED